MNWNPFRRRAEKRDLSIAWDIGPAASGGSVSLEKALQLGPVFAAGRLLASNVSALPLKVYRKTGDRRDELPLPSLFQKPSEQGTRYDWIFRAMTSMIYRGNAVGFITARNSYEYPTTVEWVNPDEVSVVDDKPSGPGSFTSPLWFWRGRPVPNVEDLVHIPWFVLPGRVWGLTPLGAYAATVKTGLSAQQYSEDWYDAGGVPPGTFENANEEVDQAEARIIKQRLVAAQRSHEPIVYGKDWKYTPISISPNEARFVETMRLGASQIAAIYGIPPEKIGGETGGSMSYSSPEQREIELSQDVLLPWTAKFESHLSLLLPAPQYVKFNLDALIRVDSATRWTNYQRARMIGAMSVDEIRALEDMPPLPNGAGEDYAPLASQGAQPTAQTDQSAALPSGQIGRPRLVAGQ